MIDENKRKHNAKLYKQLRDKYHGHNTHAAPVTIEQFKKWTEEYEADRQRSLANGT